MVHLPYESLLKKGAMLMLIVDVAQPWLNATRISDDILLVHDIVG